MAGAVKQPNVSLLCLNISILIILNATISIRSTVLKVVWWTIACAGMSTHWQSFGLWVQYLLFVLVSVCCYCLCLMQQRTYTGWCHNPKHTGRGSENISAHNHSQVISRLPLIRSFWLMKIKLIHEMEVVTVQLQELFHTWLERVHFISRWFSWSSM